MFRRAGAFSRSGTFLLVLGLFATAARGQGPQVDSGNPPGVLDRPRALGRALGASGASSFQNVPGTSDRPLGGRAGAGVSRAPLGQLSPPGVPEAQPSQRTMIPPALEPAETPIYAELDLPGAPAEAVAGALTLDAAIEQLVERNLGLLALRFEVEQADADVLTASLRANPILYFDTQFIPYSKFSNARPGGQTQYDLNVTLPLDITRKRHARTLAAREAKRVTEAQLQDAFRLQIANLYTAYVDVAAAAETLRYSSAFNEGMTRLLTLNMELLKRGQITQATTDALSAQAEQSRFQVREASEALGRTKRTLALVLNIPRDQADSLEVADALRDIGDLPMPIEHLIQAAMTSRPDLNAMRLGVSRADADVNLARAERMSDVFLLAQPYTFQDNSPFGQKSATSAALGLTIPLPIYNRNQGNIARAHSNARQTRVELAAVEQSVANEAEEAAREFVLSRDAVLDMEDKVLPASKRVRESALRRLQGGEANALEFLDAQRQYNDVVRRYRDVVVRHRRAMLALNTAVGCRVTR